MKVKKLVEGEEKEVEETQEQFFPAISRRFITSTRWSLRKARLVIRLRTSDRGDGAVLPSLTPIWRSAEFQEREIYDLYGIRFENHPDLRRILMWDELHRFSHAQGLSSSRTITNTSRRRMTKCWKRRNSIIRKDRRRMGPKPSLRDNE